MVTGVLGAKLLFVGLALSDPQEEMQGKLRNKSTWVLELRPRGQRHLAATGGTTAMSSAVWRAITKRGTENRAFYMALL